MAEHVHDENCNHENNIDLEALQQQIIQQQMMEIENQLNIIESRKVEFEFIKLSLEELKNKKDKELIVPLGSGVLAKAKVDDDKKVLVNIGANIIVEKDIDEAKEIIDCQIEELNKAAKMLQEEAAKYF